MKNFIVSVVVAVALTMVSFMAIVSFDPSFTLSWIELAAVFTSYSCTYLCVVESRLNYIVGVVTTGLYAYLFYTGGLIGSMVVNLYLLPVMLYGWFRWGPDKNTRKVTNVERRYWPIYLGGTALFGYLCFETNNRIFNGSVPQTDIVILVASALAQLLLDNKKIETWAVWFIVDLFAIYTYFQAGYYFVAIQFFVFLLNTLYGYYMWQQSRGIKSFGRTQHVT